MADPTTAEPEQELENFRRRWREEVSARATSGQTSRTGPSSVQSAGQSQSNRSAQLTHSHQNARPGAHLEEGEGRTYHDLPDREDLLKLNAADQGLNRSDASRKEPQTALEHYEKAVEDEVAGKLGDSLKFYRQAFKLDDRVHEKYKNKHFPPSAQRSKASQPNPSNAAQTVPNTAHHSSHGLSTSINQLMHDFASLSIPAIEPPTDASPQPPCPIADLPGEIMAQILSHVALRDVAEYSRLALVCKRLAYLTMTEEQVWKAVNLSKEQGVGGMRYRFCTDVYGGPLPLDEYEDPDDYDLLPEDLDERRRQSLYDISNQLLGSQYQDSWRQMYRMRPRLRFHGVYISTVNYTRPGGASASIATWNSQIHVVTYYRYLRFYRDGTCISLLTTSEPIDVVHILSKENLPENTTDPTQPRRIKRTDRTHASKPPATSLEKGGSSHAQAQKTEQPHALPSSQIMKDALRGRWRLSGPGDGTPSVGSEGKEAEHEAEGELHIETEGVVPKYVYKMQFAIGPGGQGGQKRGSRNSRLTWRGFWSYNRLTDDWAEFGLKNDRAYVFSRVKSYATGI